MRTFNTAWKNFVICGLAASSLGLTGCQSGWKMPGSNLFAWNKKPSESTLASSGPSTYPTGPATNHSPTAVASSAIGGGSTNPYGTMAARNNIAQTPTGTSMYGAATPGGAATANGFQQNPYGLAAAQNPSAGFSPTTPSNGFPSGGFGASAPTNTMASNNMNMGAGATAPNTASNPYAVQNRNPYGVPSTGGAVPAQQASYGFPVQNVPSSPSATNNPYAVPTSGAPSGYAAPTSFAGAYTAGPATAPQGVTAPQVAAAPWGSPQAGGMPTATTGGVPAQNASFTTTSGAFRPGSTGRPTSYDFSPNATNPTGFTGGTPAMPPTNWGSAVPTTASGTGYSMPPTGTTYR